MYDLNYAKEYKEYLEDKLTQFSNTSDKLEYVEKQIFYVEVDDCWDNKDETEYHVLMKKKKELSQEEK